MELINDRVSMVEKDNELSIVILPQKNKFKTTLLVLWLTAFSVSGFYAMYMLSQATDNNHKIFWLVFISFWLYFEVLVLKAVSWRIKGIEKLRISGEVIYITKKIMGWERPQQMRIEQISGIHFIEKSIQSISANFETAYWFVGGERIYFDYKRKKITFAVQVDDATAQQLLSKIKWFLSAKIK